MNSLNSRAVGDIVDDITRLHRSLPPRAGIDEVEAAVALLRAVDKEEKTQIDNISRQEKRSADIPDELFSVREQLQKNLVYFQSREQKREAMKLLDLENAHLLFDELVQRAERCLCPSSTNALTIEKDVTRSTSGEFGIREKRSTSLEKGKQTIKLRSPSGGESFKFQPKRRINEDREKLSLIKFASIIEASSKKGSREMNLQNKLMDQVDWLPASIGKLSTLINLNLSDNQLVALPTSIGALPSLTKLDLHSNKLVELPVSIGELFSLSHLDLRGNLLTTIPPSFAQLSQLVELDLSSNRLSSLPDAVGSLVSLKKLNIEANDVEELPHTIGNCASLVELRADYNRLKCLPEAVGRMESLEILSVRYNSIKGLPTTMSSLAKLRELDVSFNELESVPESLCLVTTLVKLNVGNNFADLQTLPRSIGNLEMLEELDISNNQIRVLPDSFGMLSHLRVLHVEENPLEVPPSKIAQMEAQAVVEYMAEHVAKRAIRLHPLKAEDCTQLCFFSRPNKRKPGDSKRRNKF
ncbi:plant intracellular Ras-group-related LRR protein 4-like [Iris pallida]|uniref:Plant intracellular Ras-group-related LRR protein 4-like n=1 Tax=Iris pallida TaxID=29817 RepID=A0AAX6H7L6_IRIPA|nr:plant intracellular Ras-group-related LRR protein 4-like [Iris pallida]KAJ6836375.1 plant intracellular Ras-group-related LRR protein 4-like [Iris pallida]